MSGGDKILSSIKADCDESISAINAESEKVCAGIISDGKKQAERAAAQIAEKANKKAALMKETSKSRAELEVRNALLKRRRREIDVTFDAISDYLVNLDGESYFEILYKLASKLNGKEGIIFLNKKDLQRLPSDFEAKLSAVGVKAEVGKTAAKIPGGFILKCGDIEENMSFSAVLSEKRDEIEDLINQELFKD